MNNFDRMYIAIKRKVALDAERKVAADISDAFSRMPKSHIAELIYGEPSEDRIREIFASVEVEHLVEGW